MKPLIIVHGGAGKAYSHKIERKKGVKKAAREGYRILKNGGNAITSVVESVKIMEDNPIFNTGLGSALGIDGEVEMDAAVMRDDYSFGGVMCIKNVKNPILVAKKVMEKTEHILLAGEGAVRFARKMGFKEFNPVTNERKKQLKEKKVPSLYRDINKIIEIYGGGTVGAVGIDNKGMLAVATSTGGLMYHLPGRVGDTPLIGAGTYASPFGAASATGYGEMIARFLVTKEIVEFMKKADFQKYAKVFLENILKKGCKCGVIGITKDGLPLILKNTPIMIGAIGAFNNIKVFE